MDVQYDKRMAPHSLSLQDKKDLEKFTKFLILKTAQIIVQSRQGVKIETRCKPQTSGIDWILRGAAGLCRFCELRCCESADPQLERENVRYRMGTIDGAYFATHLSFDIWKQRNVILRCTFNISIQDCVHITEATKKAFLGDPVTSSRLPLCVEISLRTVDGDEMVLETWTLGCRPDKCDTSPKVMCTVYYRMGILLKSLISISRITPAYKLSRKQSADSYVILYHVYTGDADLQCLGEDHKQIQIGQLCTPLGTISLKLNYRTKMTMTANIQKSNDSMMVKSDHFHSDLSPKNIRNKTKKEQKEKKPVDLSKPLRAGAFVDMEKIKELHDALSLQLPPEPPLKWLLAEKEKMERKKQEEDRKLSSVDENGEEGGEAGGGAAGCHPGPSRAIEVPARSGRPGAEDQKLLKMLDCPFADGSPITDLAQFYRECINAPQLSDSTSDDSGPESLHSLHSLHSADSHSTEGDASAAALSRQLLMFESSIPEFDSVIASMYSTSTNN